LKTGVPWHGVVEAINELGVDLVIMGTHGRRGLSRLTLGSVAERVVRLAPVPVLTVHAPSES
jgi:universal stress protein A